MDNCTVEEAIAFLQKKSTTNGNSVFSHLSHLILNILETKADDAINILETSMLLKQTCLLPEEGPRPPLKGWDSLEEKFVQIFLDLFWIYESLRKRLVDCERGVQLAKDEFCRTPNYYVFETSMAEDDQERKATDKTEEKKAVFGRSLGTVPPEKGEGTNAYIYWVCSNLGDKLYRLPDVNPLQIKTARFLKKFLTGNLNAEVSAYPPFPGLEENYLRAQIARISSNTILAPNGYFAMAEVEEGTGNIEKNEEWVMPLTDELGKLESWVHRNPHLKKQGRCSLYVVEQDEGEEGEEEEEEENKETPKVEDNPEESPDLLSSVDNDAEIDDGVKPWSIAFSSSIHGLKHQIVCLRSLLWPGAYTVATKDGFSNIYVGWGLKNSPYEPPLPPEVQKEYEGDLVESQDLPPIPKPNIQEEHTESEADFEGQEEAEEDDEE